MSIVKGVYELSVLSTQYDGSAGTYKESKKCTIGSNKMQDAAVAHRAYDISLTKNVNGSKTLSFKLAYVYVDTQTGEKVANPFVGMLANEVAVRLTKGEKSYDFVIKGISEDTKSHICTYTAEDLYVQELSKNGFGVILDREKNNNIGTNVELAKEVLEGTDWVVDDKGSDVCVQTQDEALYLIKLPDAGLENVYQIIDPAKEKGTGKEIPETIPSGYALAFYSSCQGKPRRFQFVWLSGIDENGDGNYKLDEDGYILNKNCQYYIDNPKYGSEEDDYGLILPLNVTYEKKIINKYRAKRYVFSTQSEYFKPLNIYAQKVSANGKELLYYKKSTYEAPSFITNLAANTTFTSTSGWTGNCFDTDENDENASNSSDAIVTVETNPDAIAELEAGKFATTTTYTPYLKVTYPSTVKSGFTPMVVEDGLHANRARLESFANGDKFVIAWREKGSTSLSAAVSQIDIANWEHNIQTSCYRKTSRPFITFSKLADPAVTTDTEVKTTSITENETTKIYKYCVGTVSNSSYTAETLKNSKIRTFFTLSGATLSDGTKATLELEEFWIFRYVEKEKDGVILPLFPWDQSTEGVTKTKHYYFDPEDPDNQTVEALDDLVTVVPTESEVAAFVPTVDDTCAKRREVAAKESNYFNILQSIAEKFECWLEIDTSEGKKVRFKNYVGKEKSVGFRYGLNLNQIQRTNDSKAITTKLIVKSNSNELAENGFCTVARAKANPTGETALYDFSYYFNQGLLSKEAYLDEVNSIPETDVVLNYKDTTHYYYKLKLLNNEMLEKNERLIEILPQKTNALAKLQIAENGERAAREQYEEALSAFEQIAEWSLDWSLDSGEVVSETEIKAIENNSDLLKYFTQAREALTAISNHSADKAIWEERKNEILAEQTSLELALETLINNKLLLTTAFYKKYSRFIQEGTWISEDYIDDEKYYLDAQNTLYHSCWPQVTYSISVANLENQVGYEVYSFDIGDRTYVQDPEFFGYLQDGITPYRKEIVVSEKTEYIDNPQKDTVKVQTFKNQFQDLFKAITATVQQVQYSTGAYQRAAELAVSNPQERFRFLENALESAELSIQNAGEQTVVWDERGITITDAANTARQLRLVSGAMMFRTIDENGEEVWKTGITPDGITADLITAGRLDAGLIQIMDKNRPSFRWDARGLTAYKEESTDSGVRFNSRGLFGFSGVANAHIGEVDEKNATFYLSEDGMKIEPPHFGSDETPIDTNNYAAIGKVDDEIYKGWRNSGLPAPLSYADEDYEESPKHFVKIMEVGSITKDEKDNDVKTGTLTIYSDGTITAKSLLVTDSVGFAAAASPNQVVYHAGADGVPGKPAEKTLYSSFPDEGSSVWHKDRDDNDNYYSKTEDGGYTWSVVYSLDGKTDIEFSIYSDTNIILVDANNRVSFDQTINLVAYGEDIPASATIGWKLGNTSLSGTQKTLTYKFVQGTEITSTELTFTASIDGSTKTYKILVDKESEPISCYVESSAGFVLESSETGNVTLTARIFRGTTEVDPIKENEEDQTLDYTWYIDGVAQTGTAKQISRTPTILKGESVWFTATAKSTTTS